MYSHELTIASLSLYTLQDDKQINIPHLTPENPDASHTTVPQAPPPPAPAAPTPISDAAALAAALESQSARPQAVIIETDLIPNLVPIMLHFATVLGPAWGVVLFTLESRYVAPMSPPFRRLAAAGRIEVRFLPPGTALASSAAVSRFLTTPWLWEQQVVGRAARVLLFQSDSILCSRAEAAAEDFLEWDFLGAPIAAAYGAGFNGGLSVRNPALFLNITREASFADSGHEFEDQFFYAEAVRRGARLPSAGVAKTFSVETIYYETPLGYHQPQRWQADHMGQIEEWCPEVKMLIGRRAQ